LLVVVSCPVGARACRGAAAGGSGLPEPRLRLAPRGPRPAPLGAIRALVPDGAQRGRRRAAEAVAVEVERQREQQQPLGKVRTMLRRRRDAVAREEAGAPLFLRAGARGEALEHHLRPKTGRPKTGRQPALRRPAQRAQRTRARRRRPARPARRRAPPSAGYAPPGRARGGGWVGEEGQGRGGSHVQRGRAVGKHVLGVALGPAASMQRLQRSIMQRLQWSTLLGAAPRGDGRRARGGRKRPTRGGPPPPAAARPRRAPARGTRRVRLVRGEGRGVST